MRCPVCSERLVKFETVENADVFIRCMTDGDFIVTCAAFGKLEKAEPGARQRALNRAILVTKDRALPRIRKSMIVEKGTAAKVGAPTSVSDRREGVCATEREFMVNHIGLALESVIANPGGAETGLEVRMGPVEAEQGEGALVCGASDAK